VSLDREPHPSWLPPAAATPLTEPAAPPPLPPPEPERQPLLKRAGSSLLLLGALALKFGKGLFVVVKGAKFLTTSASMLVSIAAYTFVFGWQFAVGFVALLFIHEMGHYIQLRREGVKPSGMLFIPFLGAVVGARSLGGSAVAEARVGLAGPVLGTVGAALCVPLYHLTDDEMFKALAFTGFFLNLINLLPVVPLDGGRAMAAMAPWMWFLGLGAVAVLAFTFPNPVVFLILIFAAFETYRRWKTRRAGEEGNAEYYKVKPAHRLMVGAVYLGLIALLVLGMDLTHVERDFDDV
jgi:Zn-dependent protease